MTPTDGWPDAGADAWIALSSRLQRFVATRSGRTDVVVRIAPGLRPDPGPAWSGVFRPGIAEVELDARTVLDEPLDDPAAIDPADGRDRARHPRLLGATALASAHAAHSIWVPPGDLPAPLQTAVQVLERTRVLTAHVRGRPVDRRRLRAAAPAFVIPDPRWNSVDMLGLVTAGVIGENEALPARSALTESAGEEGLRAVMDLLSTTSLLADGDDTGLLAAARSLCSLLGVADATDTGTTDARDTTPEGPATPRAPASRRDDPVGLALDRLSAQARQVDDELPSPFVQASREIETAHRQHARAAFRATFEEPRRGLLPTRREPDAPLRLQARVLADSLRRARFRHRSASTLPSATPPGVLRLAEAMRREAQRAAGARITARPWLQGRRREVDQPPLRVGLSWDVSGSRAPVHAGMADLAWALAWAMAHVEGELAAVAWGSTAVPVVWPGTVPSRVVEPPCGGGSSACPQSLRALDGALDLTRGTGLRLVIVMTDSRIAHRRIVRDEVDALVSSGVRVLWVTPVPDPRAPHGATALVLADPGTLVAELGKSICSILSRTSR